MKQRKAKEVVGEACGGQDGGRAWRVGRTAEDRLLEVDKSVITSLAINYDDQYGVFTYVRAPLCDVNLE